jgi:hypothetical protein
MTRRLLWTVLGAAVLASAQTAPPLLSIARAQVRPERMAEYLEIQTKFTEAYKKSGASFRYVLVGSVGNPNEVITVSSMNSYAERDAESPVQKALSPAEWASLTARRSQCTVSVRTTIERTLPDESIRTPDLPMPRFIRETRTRVRPNMQTPYRALIKSDLLPALKKLGVKSYLLRQVQWGSSRVEFAATSILDKWADLDGPANSLEGAMGKEAYARYSEKMAGIVAFSEYSIFRLVAAASYRNP